MILTKDGVESVVEKTVYGTDATKNNIGQIAEQYDQSGKQEIKTYDFKGNPLQTTKKFAQEYKNYFSWDDATIQQFNNLTIEQFNQSHTYDALNRPLTQTMPDNSVIEHTYNEAGLLETVKKDTETYVSNINYNEKGQREAIYYSNGSKTKYEYDPNTFRLTRLLTTRNNGIDILQDISYIYDPVGNIVEMNDAAQQTHYFNNSVIEPKGKYWYDALYRLVKATGRENEAIAAAPGQADLAATTGIPYNNGANHLKNYTQTFEYDKLGNIGAMKNQGQWTRNYYYDTINKNRLTSHDDTSQTVEYTYDAHGNMLSMPGIPTMEWDYADRLHKAISGTSTAFYNYDIGGNRIRKVVEKQDGSKEVRIYIGNFEIYRKFDSNEDLVTERKTVFVTDGDKRIATIDTLTVDNKVAVGTLVDLIRYQYDNHLGSASLELDENAATISYEEYHPFGTSSYRLHSNSTEVSRKRYRYVGKERDEETGLYYYGARYYAAWIARFISTDPMKAERTWVTPYNYVQNNPINRTDPTGELDDEWDYNISTGEATKVGDKGGKETQHINIKDGDGNLLNTVTTPGSDFRIDQLTTEVDGETNVDLRILSGNEIEGTSPKEQMPNDDIIHANNIEGQLPTVESQPEPSAPADKVSEGLTMAGIGSDVGQYSSRASWGKYKNSANDVVKIESTKYAKGKIKYSKQGNVSDWGNIKRYSKHAKRAIKWARAFKTIAKWSGFAGIGLSLAELIYTRGENWERSAIDIGFSILAIGGGPVGAAISAIYFIGTMIPGGWEGIAAQMKNTIMQIHNLHRRDGVMTAPWIYGK